MRATDEFNGAPPSMHSRPPKRAGLHHPRRRQPTARGRAAARHRPLDAIGPLSVAVINCRYPFSLTDAEKNHHEEWAAERVSRQGRRVPTSRGARRHALTACCPSRYPNVLWRIVVRNALCCRAQRRKAEGRRCSRMPDSSPTYVHRRVGRRRRGDRCPSDS